MWLEEADLVVGAEIADGSFSVVHKAEYKGEPVCVKVLAGAPLPAWREFIRVTLSRTGLPRHHRPRHCESSA